MNRIGRLLKWTAFGGSTAGLTYYYYHHVYSPHYPPQVRRPLRRALYLMHASPRDNFGQILQLFRESTDRALQSSMDPSSFAVCGVFKVWADFCCRTDIPWHSHHPPYNEAVSLMYRSLNYCLSSSNEQTATANNNRTIKEISDHRLKLIDEQRMIYAVAVAGDLAFPLCRLNRLGEAERILHWRIQTLLRWTALHYPAIARELSNASAIEGAPGEGKEEGSGNELLLRNSAVLSLPDTLLFAMGSCAYDIAEHCAQQRRYSDSYYACLGALRFLHCFPYEASVTMMRLADNLIQLNHLDAAKQWIEKARQLATAKVSDRDRKQAIESSAASGLIVIYQTLGNEKAAQDLLMQQAKTFTRFTRGNNNLLPENNP